MRVSKFENGTIPVPGRAYGAGDYISREGYRAPLGQADSSEDPRLQQLLLAARIAARLAAPVLLLFVLLGAVYLYADAAIPAAWLPRWAEGYGLGISDLVLPGCWTLVHLTNRRFGPAYAFGQLMAALALCLLTALVNPGDIRNWLPDMAALTWRGMLSFFLEFGLANFVAIVAFDAARGPRWWSAPLAASIAASFVHGGLYYPLAFGLLGAAALAHFILFLLVSGALMLPYWLLRPAMRPLPGMNGY
jgi:hypothetical protein